MHKLEISDQHLKCAIIMMLSSGHIKVMILSFLESGGVLEDL